MASGFPESVPAWYTAPSGASSVHDVGAAADRGEREAAADDLAEDREVGRDAEPALRAAGPDAEAGDHLVEHEERAVRGRSGARRRSRKPAPGGTRPMLAAIGSTSTAASSSPCAANAASSAATSLYGTTIGVGDRALR